VTTNATPLKGDCQKLRREEKGGNAKEKAARKEGGF